MVQAKRLTWYCNLLVHRLGVSDAASCLGKTATVKAVGAEAEIALAAIPECKKIP